MLKEFSHGRREIGGRIQHTARLEVRFPRRVEFMMVETRQRAVVAKLIPQRRVIAASFVDSKKRQIWSNGDNTRRTCPQTTRVWGTRKLGHTSVSNV